MIVIETKREKWPMIDRPTEMMNWGSFACLIDVHLQSFCFSFRADPAFGENRHAYPPWADARLAVVMIP